MPVYCLPQIMSVVFGTGCEEKSRHKKWVLVYVFHFKAGAGGWLAPPIR